MNTPACILVIDDDAAIRANLKRFLTLEGYLVEEAADGKTGLAKAAECGPDLVLCDVMMPEFDGFEVCRRLRADAMTEAIPFIFLTASVEMDDRRFGLDLGADDYQSKPFNLPALLDLIRRRLAA
jgi:DNA-binding response OmpR family regulator